MYDPDSSLQERHQPDIDPWAEHWRWGARQLPGRGIDVTDGSDGNERARARPNCHASQHRVRARPPRKRQVRPGPLMQRAAIGPPRDWR
jgi:hypothetical protein